MLDGWIELTPELLEERRSALSPEDLKRFYDGQEPQWRHALAAADQIPRRPVAVDGLAKLRAPTAGSQAMVLLVGADGLGKSTALRQIACDLVGDGRRVLFRSPGARLDPSAVAELPSDGGWILASDEANEIAPDVQKAAEQLSAAGRHDIHWLLSARDVAWKSQFIRNGRSLEPPWDQFVELWPTLSNRATVLAVTAVTTEASAGLGAWAAAGTLGAIADAPAILGAWEVAGCLGAVADLPAGERAEALEERANKKVGVSDATLLGASLDLRYRAEGLPAFVEEAVHRLDGEAAQAAFLFAAAAQVAGVDGLDLVVLADLVGVERQRSGTAILGRLAEAGLASGSAGAMRPRHPAVARVAVQLLAEGRFQGDLEDVFRRLIRGTAATGNDVKALVAGGAIMNCGPLLAEKLQQIGMPVERSYQVACAVADEAEQALPDFLLFTVGRARTHLAADRPVDARRILRAHIADATSKGDWDVIGRSFLHELSGPETSVGRLAEGAALAGLALADCEGLGQVLMADAKVALLALGAACTELAEEASGGPGVGGADVAAEADVIDKPASGPSVGGADIAAGADVAAGAGAATGVSPDDRALFRRQLRACSHLGEKVTPKWDQRARFDFHTLAGTADDYLIPATSAAEALLWLGETVNTAIGLVEDPEVKDLARRLVPEGGKLTYSHLEYTIGLGRLPWAKE